MSTERVNQHGVVVTPWWALPPAALVRFLRSYGFLGFLVFYLHMDRVSLVRVVRLVQEEAPTEAVGYVLELVTLLVVVWALWRLICGAALLMLKPHLRGMSYWVALPESRPRVNDAWRRGDV